MRQLPVLNSDMTLFQITGDKPSCLGVDANIERLEWRDKANAYLHVSGLLPLQRELLQLQDRATLALLNKEYGARDEYREEDVIMRFLNCMIRSKWFDDVMAKTPEHIEAVGFHVTLDCKLEIV